MLAGLVPTLIGGAEVATFCLISALLVYTFARLRTLQLSIPGVLVFVISTTCPIGAGIGVALLDGERFIELFTAMIAVATPAAVVLAIINLLVVGELES